MNRWIKLMLFAGVVFALSLNQNLMAQGGGGGGGRRGANGGGGAGGGGGGRGGAQMDPAQRMAMQSDRIRTQLEVTSDDDWKALQPLVEKLVTAQNESRTGMGGMMAGGRRGGNQAGGNAAPAVRPGQTPNPEAEALRQALDAKAPAAEISTKLAAFRAAQKAKEAKLDAARENLRKVLSVRQEALAVQMQLLR
jgi:hypothetical protein